MVVVCKAQFENLDKNEDACSIQFFEDICKRKDEESLIMAGKLKTQMRPLESVVPKITSEELAWHDDEDINLTEYLKSEQEKKSDEHCDSRQCRTCGMTGSKKFESYKAEKEHRYSGQHKR